MIIKEWDFYVIVVFEIMQLVNLTETKFSSDKMPDFIRIGKILHCIVVILHRISLNYNAKN